jgi:hypothetical protein
MVRSIRNLSPHKFFVMKSISVEGVNSGNLETCCDVPRRIREMQRRVDNTLIVIYCHCMARMVSYSGIKRMVHLRLKVACRQLRPGGGVYVCNVEEKREQLHHSVCSTLMSFLRIVTV